MNEPFDRLPITALLRDMPKASIPPDLIAAIEARTILKVPWWQAESFRLRWAPALVAAATALGALWLSRFQQHPDSRAVVPIAARPAARPEFLHAFASPTESSNSEKGESRENPKS